MIYSIYNIKTNIMEKALILAAIIGPFYLVLGLSLLFYVKQWQKIFVEYAKNHFLMMINMFMALILGLIIINIYNVWEWNLYVIITITGWGALLKGVFYFLAPGSWIKGVLKCKCYHSEGWLYFWGLLMTVVGILLSYNAYFVA